MAEEHSSFIRQPTEMSMKLSSAAFVAVILFIVISDYRLQATQNNQEKKRPRDQDKPSEKLSTATKKIATANTGSTNCDQWNLDSIIQLEINGEPTCVATFIDKSGCSAFATVITQNGTLQAGIAAPVTCLEKVAANLGRVRAKTADGTLIPFVFSNGAVTLLEPTRLNVIPGARKKLSSGTKGMTTVRKDGTLTLKEFVIVDPQDCDIHEKFSNTYFCAENAANEKINAGDGSPFFLKLNGRQFAMGQQIEYYNTTGRNTYSGTKVGTLVTIPDGELELTSDGVFDDDSVVNIEQNGTHLCLACAMERSDTRVTAVLMPIGCNVKIQENIEAVKYKTVNGEDFPLQVSAEVGGFSHDIRDHFKIKFELRFDAGLPVGMKGMAATWDKENVVWKQFIVTDIADCGVDPLVAVLKYPTGTLDKFFCIKHTGGEKLNAGYGASFFIKVRGTQYLLGVQNDYADDTGGNLYYRGDIVHKS